MSIWTQCIIEEYFNEASLGGICCLLCDVLNLPPKPRNKAKDFIMKNPDLPTAFYGRWRELANRAEESTGDLDKEIKDTSNKQPASKDFNIPESEEEFEAMINGMKKFGINRDIMQIEHIYQIIWQKPVGYYLTLLFCKSPILIRCLVYLIIWE